MTDSCDSLSPASILTVLDEIEANAFGAIASAQDSQELESLRIQYLGRKAKFSLVMRSLGQLAPEERAVIGKRSNQLRTRLENSLKTRTQEIKQGASEREKQDPSLPGADYARGAVHPITQITQRIVQIFQKLNFEWAEGREVESDFYNFTALNIPLDHPSRDGFDTFFTPGGNLLRSQTSTVQIRVMQKRKPPLRIVAPGRVYRPDTVDASHSFMFHQIEGLMVDDHTTFSDLKGILHAFLRELFGPRTEIRFRPHFFPFTEPSVEVDLRWGNKWLEILGAGSVHPAVFEAVGYDPKKVQGFAFGLGVERLAMLSYGINDIRHFYENDLRFLNQFQ